MPVTIYTESELATRFEDALTDENPSLTNFVEGTFNDDYRDAIAEYLADLEYKALAAELAGWVETAGGPLTAEKLRAVGKDPTRIEISEVEKHTDRSDLDALARQNGVVRDPGEFATGEALFTVNTSDVSISAGTVVTTAALPDGTTYAFETTAEVSPAPSATVVTAPIRALVRGDQHNVGSGTITAFDERPTGVETVTNPDATAGGEDEEGQASLRERARTALTRSSGGGTVRGMEGAVEHAFGDVDPQDVLVIEHLDPSKPPYADAPTNESGETATIQWGEVVVDTDTTPFADVEALIDGDEVRSACRYFAAVEPTTVTVDVTGTLETSVSDVDPAPAENAVADLLSDLGLGADVRDAAITTAAMTADSAIVDVDALTIVTDEAHTYQSGTAQYALDQAAAPQGVESVTAIVSGTETTLTAGTDYAVVDGDGDGYPDAIDFSVGGATPDDATTFTVVYQTRGDVAAERREKIVGGTVSFEVRVADDGGA